MQERLCVTERDFESLVWMFWTAAGIGVLVYGLIAAPVLMLLGGGLCFGFYRLFGGK